MEFICSKEEILSALTHAEGVISSRTTLSILSNVLIEAEENSIKLSSTDLEVGFKTTIPANIKKNGGITLQAKKLSEIIKSFAPCNLKFILDEQNRITIASEDPKIKAKFKLIGMDKTDYPKVPDFEENQVLTLNQGLLRSMIKKTIISVSSEEARYFLNGIYFEKKENILTLVATDGKRLSYINTPIEEEREDFNVIIPTKVLMELVKNLGETGTCRLSFTENKVFFQIGKTELVSSLLEGQFPNYKQVIPNDIKNILTLDTLAVTEAIKRVSVLADPKLSQIRFDLKNGKLTLFCYNPDSGESKDELEAEYDGADIQIGFNYIFLLNALKEVEQKEVYFKITDNKRPMLIEGKDANNYFSVIMPMKLSEE